MCILYSLFGDGTGCLICFVLLNSIIVFYEGCKADSSIIIVYPVPIIIDMNWGKGRFCLQKWYALHFHGDWRIWSRFLGFTVVGLICLLTTSRKDAALNLKPLSSFFSNRFDKLDSPCLFHFSYSRLIPN